MAYVKKLLDELQRTRDEIALKIHLGQADAKDEWHALEEKWRRFGEQAAREIDEEKDKVSEALEGLSDQLRAGYERVKKSLE